MPERNLYYEQLQRESDGDYMTKEEFDKKSYRYKSKVAISWLFGTSYKVASHIIESRTLSPLKIAVITSVKEWSDSHEPTKDEIIEAIAWKMLTSIENATILYDVTPKTVGYTYAFEYRKEKLKQIISEKGE